MNDHIIWHLQWMVNTLTVQKRYLNDQVLPICAQVKGHWHKIHIDFSHYVERLKAQSLSTHKELLKSISLHR